ncbi:hypothetical protein OG689_11050 [Kitasatospora sp. NBC_00240]|uniref:hypothetical protein n=1 Tax=Kitasatospora sp. NBC_00240 TaxID=2903567 RepID=UPI00225A5106|nr:hypothetical protein [Kitasatospora sp. NBC_00240]MCX5209822.1 hypothetical protein [Kitasatospora sp. NBC_00240]
MAINSNWPWMEHAWGPRWNANAAAIPLEQYVDVGPKTRRTVGTNRGRQYELDQVRSGSIVAEWANTTGEFDALNTASPWYGHMQLWQPYRLRAQWPPTVNLLTAVQATGGDSGGYSAGLIPGGQSGIAVSSATDSTGGSIVASGTAFQGARAFQFAVPAATASGTSVCATSQPALQPGQPASLQLRVRDITPSTSLTVQAYMAWYNASGTLISTTLGGTSVLTGSATASWTQVTVSLAAVPVNTASCTVGVRTAATSPGSTVNVQVDAWQLEQAAAPTSWVEPGTWYPMWAGFVDRYPQSWALSGTYGTVLPNGYDAFSLLSQRQLRDPLTEEIYSRSPRFVYTLGDPQDSSLFADAAGNCAAAVVSVSKSGAGTLTAGNQVAATDPVNGIFTGASSTVVSVANPNPGTVTTSAATYISLGAAGIAGPTSTAWTRMIAFRNTAGAPPAAFTALWSGFGAHYVPSPTSSGTSIQVILDSFGAVRVNVQDSSGNGGIFTSTSTTLSDGNWHLVIFGQSSTASTLFLNVDGVDQRSTSFFANLPSPLLNDNLGAWLDPQLGDATIYNLQGDIAFATEWPSLLSAADCTAVYSAWRSAFAGESTSARYQRILGWAGYTGPTSIQAGQTTSMGSAANVGGQDALTALQAVVDTENGAHYVDRAGVITFKSRGTRYNALTPVYTFGENTAGGEIPYEGLALDWDGTHIANQVTVTQQSTGQAFSAQDIASVTRSFPRKLSRTINTSSAQECQDAANYLISRYKAPAMRVASLTLHPSANPTLLWPVCLALELGTRIRVVRRPPAPASSITLDCFVESLAWTLSDDNEAVLNIQCSPVDLTPYGLFASFRTTLNGSPASGVTTLTINTGSDNTNPAAAQIGVNQQLIIGLGTANVETVTVKSVSSTTAGWTTAVLTLTTATTKSHTNGDVICEPLPAGVTDPTTWNNSAKFDSVDFAY